MVPLLLFVPFVVCYARDSERKFWNDGKFKLGAMIKGTPAGGLPFLFGVVTATLGSSLVAAYARAASYIDWSSLIAYGFWMYAMFFFAWSIGRLASAYDLGLKSARTITFIVIFCLWFLPVPFLAIVEPTGATNSSFTVWDLYILRPLMGEGGDPSSGLAIGVVLAAAGAILLYIAKAMELKSADLREGDRSVAGAA